MKRTGFIDGRRVAGWRFPATDAPGKGQVLTVNDYSPAAAYVRELHYNILGAKTATYAMVDWVKISIQNTVVLGYGKWIDVDSVDNPTIAHFSAMVINMRDPGDNCDGWMCLDLNFFAVGTPSARYGYIKCRAHTAVTPTAIMMLEGAPTATYLLHHAQPAQGPFGAGGASDSGADSYHLKCLMGGMEVRIPLWFG